LAIVNAATSLLDDAGAYLAMTRIHNPYGDGHACAAIASAMTARQATPELTTSR
jgi:UDP-N-acetylglucosamine 2-epimerase (non-hydrolysing)